MLPKVIRIEPASSCNLKCRHCPTGTFSMPRTIMTKQIFNRCLEEIEKHYADINAVVLYHGGEPFLNPRFFEMAESIKKTGVKFVKTVSNGMLLRESFYEKVLNCGIDAMEFSLDGLSPEDNNYIRRNSDFNKVSYHINNILNLKKEKKASLKTSISTVQFLSPENLEERKSPPEVPQYLIEAFSEHLDIIEFKTTWGMLWPSALPANDFDLIHELPLSPATQCSFLDETLTIRANGNVVVCCYDLTSISSLGNIMDNSIEEIWNGSFYQKYRNNFKNQVYLEPCNTCVVTTGKKYLIRKKDSSEQKILKVI